MHLSADKAAAEGREYCFSAIDRAEFSALFDFLNARKVNVLNPEVCR